MPTPKQKRIVILESSYSPSSLVANLNLTMDAQFATHTSVATVSTFEDSSTTGTENSEYKMAFSVIGSSAIGSLTVSFMGEGDDAGPGISVAKTTATSTSSDPTASSATVTPIASPTHSYVRGWQQPVLERDVELIDNLGGVDIRVKAESGYNVTQTVTSTADDELILSYLWTDANGLHLSEGTVKFEASSTVLGDYELGEITVTDNPSSSRLTGEEGRKALRERIRAAAKELRRLRKERRKAARDERKDDRKGDREDRKEHRDR